MSDALRHVTTASKKCVPETFVRSLSQLLLIIAAFFFFFYTLFFLLCIFSGCRLMEPLYGDTEESTEDISGEIICLWFYMKV